MSVTQRLTEAQARLRWARMALVEGWVPDFTVPLPTEAEIAAGRAGNLAKAERRVARRRAGCGGGPETP